MPACIPYSPHMPELRRIAGVKDKHATTFQEVTLAGAGPGAVAALRALAATGRLPGLRISAIRPCAAPLAPGRHAGNRFRILIRNVTRPEAAAAAGRRLRRRGFVNYFGLQRFGTGSAPAVEVRTARGGETGGEGAVGARGREWKRGRGGWIRERVSRKGEIGIDR